MLLGFVWIRFWVFGDVVFGLFLIVLSLFWMFWICVWIRFDFLVFSEMGGFYRELVEKSERDLVRKQA